MKRFFITSIILLMSLGLIACGTEGEEELTDQEKEEQTSYEPITPEEFNEYFLMGDFERIYEHTSEEFQENVTFEQFKGLGENFNEGVVSYEVISEIPIQNVTEYQWISDKGDKGIRSIFSDDLTIEGLLLVPITSYPETDERFTENTYRMPVTEEWFTFWGGTNELLNYHYPVEGQRYAYDLVIMEGVTTFNGDPTDNESYFAFGKEVVAPNDGIIVSVENDIADNTPTVDTNVENPLGNHVIIEHENNEYSVIAHFRKGSLTVDVGDEVSSGEVLGLVGNSGNSSEPHIHFHIADGADWEEASSIRIKFESGEEPVRGDTVSGF